MNPRASFGRSAPTVPASTRVQASAGVNGAAYFELWRSLGQDVRLFDPIVVVQPLQVSVGDGARIDSFVKIEGGQGVSIGAYVHIASFAHINIGGGEVELGDGSAFASGAKILGGSNLPSGESMSASAPQHMQVVERKCTIIERNAFVGVNAVVMPGVTVGEGAVIGAGAVVTKDVPAYEIWAGVPARKIGARDALQFAKRN